MAIEFVRASRKNIPIKIAMRGPSGSGKTYSALLIARGLVGPAGKILVLDTENASAQMYADTVTEFDTYVLGPPFNPRRYIDVIEAAEKEGYDCIIIDSISHAWAKEGGVLDMKDKLDAGQTVGGVRGKERDGFGNWRHANKFQEPLIDAILQTKMHVICTTRTKTDWVIEQVEKNGRMTNVPRKIGLAPVQRDDVEYEFSMVFDIDGKTHVANTSKDRSGLFDDFGDKISEGTGKLIRQWLDGGAKPIEERVAVPVEIVVENAPKPVTAAKPAAVTPANKPVATAGKPAPKVEETIEMAFPILKVERLQGESKWDAFTSPTHYLFYFRKNGILPIEEGQTIMAKVRVAKTEQMCFDGRKRRVAEILGWSVPTPEDNDLAGPIE